MLVGFYNLHRVICDNPLCPSKRKSIKNTKFVKELLAENIEKEYIIIVEII